MSAIVPLAGESSSTGSSIPSLHQRIVSRKSALPLHSQGEEQEEPSGYQGTLHVGGDDHPYVITTNLGKTKTTAEKVSDFCSDNPFRFFQFWGKFFKALEEAVRLTGGSLAKVFKEAGNAFTGAWVLFSITVFPKAVLEASKAVSDVRESEKSGAQQLHVKMWQKISGAMALGGYAASSVLGWAGLGPASSLAKNVADGADAVENTSMGALSAQGWYRANAMAKAAGEVDKLPPEIKQSFQETARYRFLMILKAVCSVAGFVFGAGLLIAGGPIVPAIVALTVSLASTVFAVAADFYKRSMVSEPVEFPSGPKVPLLVS